MNKEYITISDINRIIKFTIESNSVLKNVYIKGEISNLKFHSRGHLYFSLKDENSKINAVMFNYKNVLKFIPKDGDSVLVHGRVSVYEATGSYQIYVDSMDMDGTGNLYILFEELKKKLSSEGLFDQSHKKKIKRIPRKIGVITAPTGAAIKDIISTINKRYPLVTIYVFPTLVQGELASKNIVRMIEYANTFDDIDTIILGRGGGAIEDLWPFNEEIVARKVFSCKTPIISGVGHQIDFTICDFVADVRAETPTGAAERAVPLLSDLILEIKNNENRCTNVIKSILENNKLKLKKLTDNYIIKNPLGLYEIKEQKLDNIIDKANTMINAIIYSNKSKLEIIKNSIIFKEPKILYENKMKKNNHLIEKLEILNPLNALKRGYSITKKDGKCITSIKEIKEDDNISIIIKDGMVNAKIMEVKNG